MGGKKKQETIIDYMALISKFEQKNKETTVGISESAPRIQNPHSILL